MTFNYASWMGDHVYRKSLLGNIPILGTHNSGVYNGQNTIMVKCQEKNILEQLFLGIRCFDIRVRVSNNWYVMHHNDHCPPIGNEIERQQYEAALNSIKTFLTMKLPHYSTENEIILIFLSGSDNGNLTPEQEYYVLQKVQDVFGELLFDKTLTPNITYEQLLESNQRVLLFTKSLNKLSANGGRPDWALDWNQFVQGTWVSEQSQFGDPLDSMRLAIVEKNVTDAVSKRANDLLNSPNAWPSTQKIFLSCDFNIWTTNVGGLAESQVNPMATRVIRKLSSDPILKSGTNIMSVDFFNLPNTDLMDSIIQANDIIRMVAKG
ncbi:hypothetical protein EHQ53_08610 [Leptospira langatensis]|uniref:1-phosphatidylinositol phosphodiesterase n=1 Tax=Leptospira langatensis TaxID=2484983 RepID=A0A5F1ZUL8_9LEPT|nr:hypothetical protein [Leptospira langatensis]TGK01309.1 hypothetical protein EHO57_10260 [Leptospira langatensis]TGL42239.1 hypothetical protein EHQ53_08610 [Leptospira langatensis]